MQGAALAMTPTLKSISAVKKYPRKRRNGTNPNIAWRRIRDNFDELVARSGANPEMGSVLSRWVLFKHLTKAEGQSGRVYAEIVGSYDRFIGASRESKSPSYQRGTGGAKDEIEYHQQQGTIREYERAERKARRRFNRLQAVLARFPNAKEYVDQVCCGDVEIATEYRPHVAAILRAVGKEFGVINDGRV